jgi:hypothetical protein
MGTDTEDQTNFNPNRRLCPDGACTGVVGPAGLCLVCGGKDPDWTPGEATLSAEPQAPVVEPPPPPVESADDVPKDGKRRLCPDGTCIGILGSDGACGTCGKRGDSKDSISDS